jgi:hypothetical protein
VCQKSLTVLKCWLGLAHRLMTVVFDVLSKRLELGFLEQLTESALAVSVGGEVLAVVFAQVFDFGGGMLVVDPPAFFAGTAVQARILWGFTHTSSFRTRRPGVWTDSKLQTTERQSVFGMWAWRGAAPGCTSAAFYSRDQHGKCELRFGIHEY